MKLIDRLLGDAGAVDASERWAASGAMWLTGRPAGPMLAGPSAVPLALDMLARTLAATTARAGRPLTVDGPALLGERAALSGLERGGEVSCGRSTRLLRARDGWMSVSLARSDDLDLLPAWLAVDASRDPWPAVTGAVSTRRAVDVVSSGAELGLAVARLGERIDDEHAVVATLIGDQPPTTRLEGLRVIDLSSLWAGPLCGQLLGAAGMDVVKVESTRRPDGARLGPSAFFDLLNAGKASVALDLGAREGREALRRLLLSAEVVIEASRPRALEQLDVDVADIAAAGALRVWISITGHGRTEPHRHRTGFGDDAAVAGGLVAFDECGPVFCADAIADPSTGLLAATAVVDRLLAGGRWLVDAALARTSALLASGPRDPGGGPLAPPHARPTIGRAPDFGRDTRRILQELEPPR